LRLLLRLLGGLPGLLLALLQARGASSEDTLAVRARALAARSRAALAAALSPLMGART